MLGLWSKSRLKTPQEIWTDLPNVQRVRSPWKNSFTIEAGDGIAHFNTATYSLLFLCTSCLCLWSDRRKVCIQTFSSTWYAEEWANIFVKTFIPESRKIQQNSWIPFSVDSYLDDSFVHASDNRYRNFRDFDNSCLHCHADTIR